MSTRMVRAAQIYGPNGRIPVGKTTFFEKYVYKPGGDEFIPGTKIKRLRPASLGERSIAFFEDELDEVVDAVRAHRDAKHKRALA